MATGSNFGIVSACSKSRTIRYVRCIVEMWTLTGPKVVLRIQRGIMEQILMVRLHLCKKHRIHHSLMLTSIPIRTTDTSFVDNPPTSSKATPKFSTPAPTSRVAGPSSRSGVAPAARGGVARGGIRGARGSGLARAKGHSMK